MTSSMHILRSRWVPALALLGTLALPGLARADFEITYVFTNTDGIPQPSLRLQAADLNAYSNQASCECGHTWGARVFLNNSTGTAIAASTQVRTYVGANCDVGQNSVGQQQYPCVKMFEGLANEYDDGGILLPFEQIWLSSRVESFSQQSVGSATPRLPCDPSQTGGAGIWICVESNGQPDCQSEEFVVRGDSSVNASSSGGSTGTGTGTGTDTGSTPTGILFDYVPPQSTVSGFVADPGDGKVVIQWSRSEVPDVSGFRVLCADMDGNPPASSQVSGIPTGRSRTNGKLYYTAENLCPGEVVYTPDPNAVPDPVSTTGDSSDSGSSGSPLDEPWLGGGWSMATGTGTDTGTDTGTSTGISTSTSTGTDTGTGDSSGSDSTTGGDLGDSPLASLDWSFVCSDHVTSTGTKIDVLGLENDKPYQFIVVAYDPSGNPRVMSKVLYATPAETSDFWEQCEKQGDICGNGGFCSCRADEPTPPGAWLGAGLLLLGLARRRRSPR